jgi:hypothetical protein
MGMTAGIFLGLASLASSEKMSVLNVLIPPNLAKHPDGYAHTDAMFGTPHYSEAIGEFVR